MYHSLLLQNILYLHESDLQASYLENTYFQARKEPLVWITN